MKIVQCHLKNLNGNETLVTWLDVHPQLKPGVIVSLRDFKPEERWQVAEIYGGEHDAIDFDFHRKWDNNNYDKHKGLGI